MPIRHATSTCECGKVIDGDGYHLMTCKTGGGLVWTHEALANTWSDCLQQLNISHRREPRDHYSNSDIELDISVAHPWNKDILSKAADEGIAAAKGEVSKNKKYSSELHVWGNSSNCIPLVFEHFGV